MASGDALDPEWFYRRRQFCEARIKAWTRPDRPAPPAGVVAGLQKELAAIALIQGDMETARTSLARAGELLLKQTSAQGLVYLGLAGAHRVADDPLARTIIDVAARLDEPRNPDERRIKGTQYYAPTISRTPVTFDASHARTIPATELRSTMAIASRPQTLACPNSSSQELAPRRKEKCDVVWSSAYPDAGMNVLVMF